jgi:hypothetical protein
MSFGPAKDQMEETRLVGSRSTQTLVDPWTLTVASEAGSSPKRVTVYCSRVQPHSAALVGGFQAGGGLGGVMLLGSSLHDVWRSLPTVSCIGGAGKARAAAFFSMLVIFALLHQLVTTGTATRPSRSPMSQLHSVGGMGGGERASSLVVAGGVQELPPLNLDAWGPPPLSLVDWSLSVATEGGADTKSREKGIGQHKNGTKGGKHHGGKGGKMPPPSMPPPPLPHAPPKLTPRERRFVERAIAAARASGGGNGGDGGDDEAEQKKANGGSGGDGGGGRERRCALHQSVCV